MTSNQQNNRKNLERVEDLHLQLSEKYQTYKDLADRCLINTHHIDKGDKRVFYLKPESIFLDEPRKQNQYRNEFVKLISTPPAPEPLTLFADDLYKDLIEQIQDKSNPALTKIELANFYRRRQYRLQHKKYKLLQRWSHYALTSELVDKVSLKFSPTYSKLQFELENSVKRYQRLEGEDHFLNVQRPSTKENENPYFESNQTPISTLRIDDIDVYLRIVTYEEKILRDAEKLIQRIKWVPMSHRFEIFQDSIQYVQNLKKQNCEKQKEFLDEMEKKGKFLIEYKKLGQQGQKELQKILYAQNIAKIERKNHNLRDKFLNSSKYNYELPRMIAWNQIDLKLTLASKGPYFGIQGDLEIDNGHSYAYNIMVYFPTYFASQVIKSQFAIYDAVPALIDPTTLAKKNIKKVLDRNKKKYGKAGGGNTLLEMMEIKKKEEELQTEFINSIEKALFGEFNSGQIKDFPSIRIKKSTWLQFICYEPQLSKDQMYQAAVLSGDNNPTDDCLKILMDLVNTQDVSNVNLILESLSAIHHDKVKYGQIRTDFLLENVFAKEEDLVDKIDQEQVFTEKDRSFLNIFKNCLKTKSEFDPSKQSQDIPKTSLLDLPQHLLFSLYILQYLKARDSKIKLLYTLNAYRAIQKRITIDLREFGSRDRIMGDCNFLGPMENGKDNDYDLEDDDTKSKAQDGNESVTNKSKYTETTYSAMYKPKSLQEKEIPKMLQKLNQSKNELDPDDENIDVINGHLIDIHKIKFNEKFQNFIYSTNPLIPRYHSTFGEPLDRQEISAELEGMKKPDFQKEQGKKLMGRVDEIYFNEKIGNYLVKDDFGVHIMFDSALLDMTILEQEVLKICSFYINKQEPVLDQDLRNIYPAVDRFEIIEDVLDCELQFQNTKLELVLCHLECYEHITDVLEQQRMIQIIVDSMAMRPRLNLNSTYFKDSYRAEIECLKQQIEIIREVVRMQMKSEFEQNNFIREYLEKSYRLVMDQVDSKWQYQKPEGLDGEVKQRENLQKGIQFDGKEISEQVELAQDSLQTEDTQLDKQPRKESIASQQENDPPAQIFSAKFSDPKEFAAYLGIPFASLQMLMKDHKERDPLIKQSIHEHVSFIKIEEGYPIFMHDMSAKQNNTVAFTKNSERIGILDFYESLTVIVKIIAAMKGTYTELNEVHRPDNGLTSTALELSAYKFILAELKATKGERQLTIDQPEGINYIEDDSIVGNPDKMLFFTKEFVASAEDDQSSHNPYTLTKLNLKTIENFNFDSFQKILADNPSNNSMNVWEDFQKRRKIQTHHAYRFFPKLKARAQKVFIPSMLYMTCNSIELIRLRHILSMAIVQTKLLEEVYLKQVKLLGKDGIMYFKDPFNFETFIQLAEKNFINFVDDGPATGINIDLAVNEFDPSIRSHINFSDPDSFKMLICPLGLEEFRSIVFYQLMNLQILIVATKTNQILLDHSQRYISELEFFSQGYVIANPVFDYFPKLFGANLNENNLKKQAMSERSVVVSEVQQKIGPISYNIISRKNRSKNFIEKLFQKVRHEIVNPQEKHEIQLRKLRTYRTTLLQDFCYDVLSEVYSDSIKLQLLLETDQLRKRAYLMPKESLFFDIGPSQCGEYYSLNYKQDKNIEYSLFKFLKNKKIIQKFWRIPSNKEIIKLPQAYEQILKQEFNFIYQFEVKNGKDMNPNMKKNSQHKVLRSRLPKLDLYNVKELDQVCKEKKRFVEYKNALSVEDTKLMKVLQYFKALSNIFDLEFFQNKLQSNAQTLAELEKFVISGLPFWEEGDEALFNSNDVEEQNSDMDQSLGNTKGSLISNLGYKNELANKIVDRMGKEKRFKLTLHQHLEGIKDKFVEMEAVMKKLELDEDLDRAVDYLQEQSAISYYGILSCLGSLQENYLKENIGRKELYVINDTMIKLSHQNDIKVTYQNGFHVNTAVTRTDQINIDENIVTQDFINFKKAAQPIIDENALSPQQFNLIEGIYSQNTVNLRTFKKNKSYMGKVQLRDYQYLDYSMINLDKAVRKYAYQNFTSVDSQLKEFTKLKLGIDEQYSGLSLNINQYLDMLFEKKQYLKTLLKSKQLKRILMIIINKSTIPMDVEEYQKFQIKYNEEIQWKINLKWDEFQIQKLKNAEKQSQQSLFKKDTQSIQAAMKKQQEQQLSNVLTQIEQAQTESDVLQSEVQRFLLLTAFKMMDQESAALAKAFEMNGKHFEFYIHPCQQFASTLNQHLDKRNHLDILNKISFAQKFLTQIKNRCLEIETITSGVGLVISQKDMNECLEEVCRSLVKQGEIEMRTRCETYALQQVQFENLLYIKDRQLLNMEEKLKQAKKEIDKIIRTKVFSKGNQLIYELDYSTRQLRLIKDNIFEMEKKLTDQIRLNYDRELDQTRMELDECRRKFGDFSSNVNARLNADVRDNVNNIDAIMKGKAELFKDLSKITPNQLTTININNITIKNISSGGAGGIGSGLNDSELTHYMKMQKEFNTLKENEKESREEIIKLQEIIRKMRILSRFKEVLLKQKFEHKIDNLTQQLNSNTLLWEQLAESEKREKILKQELEQSQQEIVTQEKIIEQLKDEIKKERGEKSKLIQYKQTKSKRLEELETKAREFEVMQNLDLPKMLGMLESKEEKITYLKSKDKLQELQLQQWQRLKDQEYQAQKKKFDNEVKMKSEAMAKLENLRHELQLIEGQDTSAVDLWKEKCKKLIDICKSFKEENERMQSQMTFIVSKEHNIGSAGQGNTINPDSNMNSAKYNQTQPERISQYESASQQKKSHQPSTDNSTRFKLRKELNITNSMQQQLNQSFEQPYVSAVYNVNQSLVLAGGMGGPTSIIANEKLNHSFAEEREKSSNVSLPKITKRNQYLSQMRTGQDYQVFEKKTTNYNIFSGKQQQSAHQGEKSPPKTPIKMYEQESHASSVYGKLTPVYDPTKAATQQSQKKNLQSVTKASDNVFSTLTQQKPVNIQILNQDFHHAGGQGYQTSLGQFSQSFAHPNTNLSILQQQSDIQRSLQDLNQNSKIHSQSRNMNIISQSNSIYVPTANQTTLQMNHERGNKNSGRFQSNSVVRNNVISPPKALTKEWEKPGLKGYAIKKRDAPNHDPVDQQP